MGAPGPVSEMLFAPSETSTRCRNVPWPANNAGLCPAPLTKVTPPVCVRVPVGVMVTVPVMPDGAFYAYADCSEAAGKLGVRPGQADGTGGSWDFAFELMQRAHLAVTPGRDFGQAAPEKFIRFSTASSMEHLQEAVARLEKLLG